MFHGCWLRGSLGSSEIARAMAGAARLTAQGSGGGGVVLDGGGGVADVVGAVVLVGSGVFATVESPDPHPVRTASSTTAAAADARNVHIRARLPADCAPTRQAGPGLRIRLHSMTIADPAEPGAPADTAV